MNSVTDLSRIRPDKDIFSCRIIPIGCEVGTHIKEAKMFVVDDSAWICHNDSRMSGGQSPDRLGYRYSWVVSYPRTEYVQDIKITNKKWNHE